MDQEIKNTFTHGFLPECEEVKDRVNVMVNTVRCGKMYQKLIVMIKLLTK